MEERTVDRFVVGPWTIEVRIKLVRAPARVNSHEVTAPLVLQERLANVILVSTVQRARHWLVKLLVAATVLLGEFFQVALDNLIMLMLLRIGVGADSSGLASIDSIGPSLALIHADLATIAYVVHAVLHLVKLLFLSVELLYSYQIEGVCYHS